MDLPLLIVIVATLTLVTDAMSIPEEKRVESTNRLDPSVIDQPKMMTSNRGDIGPCLRIAPDISPCHFGTTTTRPQRSKNGHRMLESGYVSRETPELIDNETSDEIRGARSQELTDANTSSIDLDKNDDGIKSGNEPMIIYNLEGCLPSRLPFQIPMCPDERSENELIYTLVPFRLENVDDAPMIFPEVEVDRLVEGHPSSQINAHEYSKCSDSVSREAEVDQHFHKTMTKSITMAKMGIAGTRQRSRASSEKQSKSSWHPRKSSNSPMPETNDIE